MSDIIAQSQNAWIDGIIVRETEKAIGINLLSLIAINHDDQTREKSEKIAWIPKSKIADSDMMHRENGISLCVSADFILKIGIEKYAYI